MLWRASRDYRIDVCQRNPTPRKSNDGPFPQRPFVSRYQCNCSCRLCPNRRADSVALFDNRVEIENPGLLPFGITIEEIQHGLSKLRNRVIDWAFQDFGLIEQWGGGIQRMTLACVEQGLPAPKFRGNQYALSRDACGDNS